jgi:hypothetical protein
MFNGGKSGVWDSAQRQTTLSRITFFGALIGAVAGCAK